MECQADEVQNHTTDKQYMNGFTLTSNSSSSQDVAFEESSPIDLDSSLNEEESEVLTLLQLCRNVHQRRIAHIDSNKDLDFNEKNEEKLSALQSYLQQVEEQNDVLASTMIELEKEAQKRVKQMEKRLKSSAKTTMEAVINIHECEKEMRRLVEERLSMESLVKNMQQHLSSLKVENSFLRDQNCNLNHDIQSLLHVIHHARSTGHWEMNCVTFCEVTPEQIFGPVQSISNMYSNESPQSDNNLPEGEHKVLNSDFSSQDVTHSSRSSPSISHQLSLEDPDSKTQTSPEDACSEIQEKNKKIALLESRLSELHHQLTVKEAECECHLWKLEILMQHNQNRTQVFPNTYLPVDSSVQKCISLPDIGNIYSYNTRVLRRYHSCRVSGYQVNPPARPIRKIRPQRKSTSHKKPCHISVPEKSDSRLCKYTNKKHDHVLHRAQSEPYLFMFGDNIYVYRPCEPVKKASNVALCNDYQSSLPPCQSIDLKFPVDESNLKICDWDLVHRSSISHGVSDSQYNKVDGSSTSCSSNDSLDEIANNATCSTNECLCIRQVCSSVQSESRICYHGAEIYSSNENNTKKYSFNTENVFKNLVSLAVQTENKVRSFSIGLQTDIADDGVDLLNVNLFELDLSQLRRTVQNLKDNVLKAEDKAEAKSMLIEQLQGHITAAVKEVEMKDQALSNVEKKLESSRNECSALKEKTSSLNSEIQDILNDSMKLQLVNEDLLSKISETEAKIVEISEEQKILQNQKRALMTQLDEQGDLYESTRKELIEFRSKAEKYILQISEKEAKILEISEEQKILQNQKRALMTQLDEQGDLYESTRKELNEYKSKAGEYILQIELQNQTIMNLQEAIVKSKRASDNTFLKSSPSSNNINSNLQNEMHSSRGSIVDI